MHGVCILSYIYLVRLYICICVCECIVSVHEHVYSFVKVYVYIPLVKDSPKQESSFLMCMLCLHLVDSLYILLNLAVHFFLLGEGALLSCRRVTQHDMKSLPHPGGVHTPPMISFLSEHQDSIDQEQEDTDLTFLLSDFSDKSHYSCEYTGFMYVVPLLGHYFLSFFIVCATDIGR